MELPLPGLAVRPATDADEPFLAQVYAATRAEELAATGWPPPVRTAFLAQQHRAQHDGYRAAHPEGAFLVVAHEGADIGRLYLADVDGAVLVIDIALLPEQRGRGIGDALLDAVEADATERGLDVVLHAERNGRALGWYRRRGYVTDGPGDGVRVPLRLALS